MEFEEARKELQLELEKGTSLDEIREKIMKGNIKSKVSKQLKDKKYFSVERVRRKSRDLVQLINKHSGQPTEWETSDVKRSLTAVELWTNDLEERFDGLIISRNFFKLDDMDIMVR